MTVFGHDREGRYLLMYGEKFNMNLTMTGECREKKIWLESFRARNEME
jgi:hypothetical protein